MSILGVIGSFLLLLFVGSMALYAGTLLQMHFYITRSLPSLDKLKHYAPGIVSCVYDDRGKVIADFACQRRFVVPIRQIPWQLKPRLWLPKTRTIGSATVQASTIHGLFSGSAFHSGGFAPVGLPSRCK